MLTTLIVLVATSAAGLHVEVWMITVPAAIIMFIRDVWHDIHAHRRKSESKSRSAPSSPTQEHRSAAPLPTEVGETPQENDAIELSTFPATIGTRKGSNVSVATIAALPAASGRPSPTFDLVRRFPTPTTTLRRLPYPLLPFAFSMFILVQGLASTGWIAVFAGWWAAWARASGLLGVVGGMGFVSVCLCNVSFRLNYVWYITHDDTTIALWHQYRSNDTTCPRNPSLGSLEYTLCARPTWCHLCACTRV